MRHPLQVGWLLLCMVAAGTSAGGTLQIVQHGPMIEPVDREVTLDRTLFAVRGAPGSGALPDPLPVTDPDCGAGSLVRAARNADWQRVERLMAQGVGPNQKIGGRGAILLSCAVAAAPVHATSVMLLLERDGTLGARTARAETPLMWAVQGTEGGRFEASRADIVTQVIARGADVNATEIAELLQLYLE